MMRRAGLLLWLLMLVASTAEADVYRLEGDSIVEGSLAHGGIQPDYLVSKKDPGLSSLLKTARKIGASEAGYWSKVAKIRMLVKDSLPGTKYENPRYLAIAKRYTALGKPVPLGEYVKAGSGVCRENSLVLHLALSEAGIKSDVAYVNVEQAQHAEDHGLVVLRGPIGAGWTVDSYNENFNGVKFQTLLSKKGVSKRDPVAPIIGKRLKAARRILKITPYPKVRSTTVTSGTFPRSKMKRALGFLKKIIRKPSKAPTRISRSATIGSAKTKRVKTKAKPKTVKSR